MSSTSVHSVKPKKVNYGMVYPPDKTNENLTMPPEQTNEGKQEMDPHYRIDSIIAEDYYMDKDTKTRVEPNGRVLSGSEKVARGMLKSLDSNER